MLPVELMKMVEVACATPASFPTRKLPLARARLETPMLVVLISILFASVARSELAERLVSQVEPELVNAVVLAPPFIEKSPLEIVEEASERKPFVKVERPV